MSNPPYVVGREISSVSLSLHMWLPTEVEINLFLIVFSRGSSKRKMFGMVVRKPFSLLSDPLTNAEEAACGCLSEIVDTMVSWLPL